MAPCNCSKKSPRPLAPSNAPKPPTRPAGAVQASEAPATSATQSFVLRTTDGRTQTFGSRLEAAAAQVRAGGGTITTR